MTPLPKKELLRQVKAFLQDPNRGISIAMFAELCGVSEDIIKSVFIYETDPMTERTQIRVNRGYEEWKAGYVKIMKRPNNTRYVAHRKAPEPVFMSSMSLQASPNGIKLKIGPKNRHDYGDRPLDEQLRG